MSSLDVSSINLGEVAKKIRDAVGRIEVDCRVGGPRCDEENVKIEVEGILWDELWSKLGVERPIYEKPLGKGVLARSYKRADAFYGLTIFEYKTPGEDLERSVSAREKAVKQILEYIELALRETDVESLIWSIRGRGLTPLISGIITNGKHVIFVEYDVDKGEHRIDPETGAHSLDEGILRKIAVTVTSSWKRRFTAENLAGDFGYKADLAKEVVKKLYDKLSSPKSPKTKDLFEEWRKAVSIAYPKFGEEVKKVAKLYGFRGEVDGDKLFLAIQTYYSIILKLIAAEIASKFYNTSILAYLDYLRKRRDPEEFKRALEYVESGRLFAGLNIRNFAEKSFFSWYLEEWDGEVERQLRGIVEKLFEYDVGSVYLNIESARDMLKVLYEELIPRKEVRQKLGIYSTPDWLAELIIWRSGLEAKLSSPCSVKVLDPGCGTGTFLSLVIQKIGKRAKPSEEVLKCVVENVVGFDVEPLAVLTAKTNYLIALAATGLLNYRRGEVEIPIYMANSLMPVKFETTFEEDVEVVRVELKAGAFLIPKRLVDKGRATAFLDDLREAIDEELGIEEIARKYGLTRKESEVVRKLYDEVVRLRDEGRDTVWIPIVKSYLAPLNFLGLFDYVVGNPPWLAYRYIADPEYQSKIKEMIKGTYRLVEDEHLMTHMELATLFFVRCADEYLKSGGVIGFVMPRAVFSADQHDAFRRGEFSRPELRFEEIIDCGKVEPLFYVPTCAIIARRGDKTEFPVKALIVEGRLPERKHKVLPLSEALGELSTEEAELYCNKLGARSFLDTKKIRLEPRRSPYYADFYQGATIVPQTCWLVDVVGASNSNKVTVRSSQRSTGRGKIKETMPPMPVEREFIYGVLTSAEVLPFTHLRPNVAVLPLRPRGEGYEMITRKEAFTQGYKGLAGWLREAERMLERVRGAKEVDLYSWLDYRRKLTRQSSKKRYRVVYLRSAKYLAATIVENRSLEIKHETGRVKLNGILIDSTLYRYDTDNEEEAHYLASIFNSRVIDGLIKPMQSKGQFGPRDIHKKPLEYPIPRYDPSNEVHRRLAELGREAAKKARELLPKVLREYGYDVKLRQRGFLTPQEVGRVRGAVREALTGILEEIDGLVLEILKSLGSTLLEF